MKSVRAVVLLVLATLAVASLPSGAGAAAHMSASEQPVGTTRLVSVGFPYHDVFLGSPDVSDGGLLATFLADSASPGRVYAQRGQREPVIVSKADDGSAPDVETLNPVVAPDSSFIVYESNSSNLGPGNPWGEWQILLYDTRTHTTELISGTAPSLEESGDSTTPSISPDSRFVVFHSWAEHLAPGGEVGLGLYVYEVATGTLRALDAGTGRITTEDPAISAGGRYIAFTSTARLAGDDDDLRKDVYRYDSATGSIQLVSLGRGAEPYQRARSLDPDISADGNRICYGSTSTNLVPGDPGSYFDIYLTDVTGRTTELISPAQGGGGWPNGRSASCSISSDGQLVAFTSDATDLVASDPNQVGDVFLRDTTTGTTSLLSQGPDGQPADDMSRVPAISADGRYVAYLSWASNLVRPEHDNASDVYLTRLS